MENGVMEFKAVQPVTYAVFHEDDLSDLTGIIYWEKADKCWQFGPADNWAFNADMLERVADFIRELDDPEG